MIKRILPLLLVPALVVLSSCTQSGFGDNNDCDYLISPEGADGGQLPDTLNRRCNLPLSIDFDVEVEFLAPPAQGQPEPNQLSQFRLRYYDITYKNLRTGGSVQGVDVPRPTRVSVEAIFDLRQEETLSLDNFEILEAGATQEAPLNDSSFYDSQSGVPFVATLTWWGHPVSDPDAWCFATMEWYFTVFDDPTGC